MPYGGGGGLTSNIPHIIALGLLVFALITVATMAGILRCSDLGQAWCDTYYSIVGAPKVAIVTATGGAGIGDPLELKRILEYDHGLPVSTIEVSSVISSNILKQYSVVIVEKARNIPTRTLKAIAEYVQGDMGRLVWVGDAGTTTDEDEICKEVHYVLKYSAKDASGNCLHQLQQKGYTKEVCKGMSLGQESQITEVLEQLTGEIRDEAKADTSIVQDVERQGFCDVSVEVENEAQLTAVINPWVRGEYEILGKEGKQAGIDFSASVIGVSFVSDAYAVETYGELSEDIAAIRDRFGIIHNGLVECSEELEKAGYGCNPKSYLFGIRSGFDQLARSRSGVNQQLTAIATSLTTMNESSLAARISAINSNTSRPYAIYAYLASGATDDEVYTYISQIKPGMTDITSGYVGLPTKVELVKLGTRDMPEKNIMDYLDDAITALSAGNYSNWVTNLQQEKEGIEAVLGDLEAAIADYMECKGKQEGDLAERIRTVTGLPTNTFNEFRSYVNPYNSDREITTFIEIAKNSTKYAVIESTFKALNQSAVNSICTKFSKKIMDAFNASSEVIRLAKLVDTAARSTGAASIKLVAADAEHPLVKGIKEDVYLRKIIGTQRLPVPYVLVTLIDETRTFSVANLELDKSYMGYRIWPGITVYNPRFGRHIFARGTTVYYTFPPEISPKGLIPNLVNFILY